MTSKDRQSGDSGKQRAIVGARVRSELLWRISHELRTPLNTIAGTLELLLRSELSSGQREYCEQARLAASQLGALVADFLDVSEIESGKLQLQTEGFSLANLLSEVLSTASERGHEKGLEILCDVAEGVPDGVTGDAARLRRILWCLTDNALKFTQEGTITFRVAPADSESKDVLRFSVCDTGIGISTEDQGRIFELFAQADDSPTRRFGGTGLGLTISAQLVHLMNGRIWVESELGSGSTFHFVAHLPDTPTASARPKDEAAFPPGLRVLVVDPSQAALRLMLEILGSWGIEAVGIPDPSLALEALHRGARNATPFRLVILDPFMRGSVVFRAQRTGDDPVVSGTPQLHVLSPSRNGPIERLPGSSPSLLKPVTRWELRAAMWRALAGASVPTAPILRTRRPAALAPSINPLRLLVVEDNSVNAFVIARMLELLGHSVEVVGNGRQAVEAAAPGTFDVILMDIQMPEMDGFEAARRIRRDELKRGGRVPIVALTADATEGEGPFLGAGMDGHLTKPVGLQALRQAIERARARASGDPTSPSPTRSVIDRPRLLARLGADPEAVAEVLRRFLEEAPAAREMLQAALVARDPAALVRVTHRLKGTLRWIAADAAAEAAAHLEALARSEDSDRWADAFAALEHELSRTIDDILETPPDQAQEPT